jgi:4'-phosphopantetheinyl transferase
MGMMACEHLWDRPPAELALLSDEVHVWCAALEVTTSHLRYLQNMLSADELARASRFHFPKDRRRFIVARGVLRSLLGLYLGLEPRQLCFCYGAYGKPALVPTSGEAGLRFNVSHSHELALYAVTYGREIGVDIEYIRTNVSCEEIAERFFSSRERALLRTLPAPLKYDAFFHCWTRKEAYIKARGEGLSLPLDQFDVAFAPGEPAALLATRWAPREASRWVLRELTPGPGYAAALAVGGHGWRLACWQWPQEGLR